METLKADLTTCPNTSKFVRNTLLRVVFLTFLIHGVWRSGEARSFVFDIILKRQQAIFLPNLPSGVISPCPPSSVRLSCRFFNTLQQVLWSSYKLSNASLGLPMYWGSSACSILKENGTIDPARKCSILFKWIKQWDSEDCEETVTVEYLLIKKRKWLF